MGMLKTFIQIVFYEGNGFHGWAIETTDPAAAEWLDIPDGGFVVTRFGYGKEPLILPVNPMRLFREAVPVFRLSVEASNPGGILEIAPVVAVMTVEKEGVPRGNRNNFKDIVAAGKERGRLAYIVTPQSIADSDDWFYGYYPMEEEGNVRWVRLPFPPPHLVYNRIPERRLEKLADVQTAKKKLQTLGIAYYNYDFFYKEKLYKWLREDPGTAAFMPYTEVLKNREQLIRMISAYQDLYLKPSDGKAGAGIINIQRIREGGSPLVAVTLQHRGAVRKKMFFTIESAAQFVKNRIGRRPYVLQQGIRKAVWKGKPFDVRVLVQKDETGSWQVTGKGIRVGPEWGITTHVPNGGRIAPVEPVLDAGFGNRAHDIARRIDRVALTSAMVIERNAKGMVAEMSLDIGVDTQGDLWIFEANAKPMKFDEPDIRRRSLEKIFSFADYLVVQEQGMLLSVRA